MSENFVVCYVRNPAAFDATDAFGAMFIKADTMGDALELAAEIMSSEGVEPILVATPWDQIKCYTDEEPPKKAPKMIRADEMSKKQLAKLLEDEVKNVNSDNTVKAMQEAAKRLRSEK